MKKLKKQLKEAFKSEGIKAKGYIDIEIRLWLLQQSKNELLVKDGYLMFDDHYQALAPVEEEDTWNHHCFLLKYQKKKFAKKSIWQSAVDYYFHDIPDRFRLYQLTEDLFHKTSSDKSVMELRKGFKRFLKLLKERNVPLVIISAGLTNVIKAFLIEHEIDLDNIYIISNEIYFENGVAKGIAHDIIHSMNKSEVSLPSELKEELKTRRNVLLFGDNLKDYLMVDKENHDDVLEIAFVNEGNKKYTEDFFENYDIILNENEDFDTVLEKIIK